MSGVSAPTGVVTSAAYAAISPTEGWAAASRVEIEITPTTSSAVRLRLMEKLLGEEGMPRSFCPCASVRNSGFVRQITPIQITYPGSSRGEKESRTVLRGTGDRQHPHRQIRRLYGPWAT